VSTALKAAIRDEARRLGFILAGVTTPDPPPHLSAFENWLAQGRHASMHYLSTDRSRTHRADPSLILPGCKSILVLAIPYSKPLSSDQHAEDAASRPSSIPPPEARDASSGSTGAGSDVRGRIASYALGDDYHLVLPERIKAIIAFIESQVGHPVSNRWYTDSGPVLERDLAQRAGLGWIGKNTCLINPKLGSYFLLAEIFLDLELEPDPPLTTDHCGTCTRCIDACPTDCILPDRTLDAGRCISYLTIELKDSIPPALRPLLDQSIFGCDICQAVCPWNRFASPSGDPAFGESSAFPQPVLAQDLKLTPAEFNRKFKDSPVRRAKRRGYLRNAAVALGNAGSAEDIPALEEALKDPEPLVREHAAWAINAINEREL
jgi:epoxyqueuosine reductase